MARKTLDKAEHRERSAVSIVLENWSSVLQTYKTETRSDMEFMEEVKLQSPCFSGERETAIGDISWTKWV